MRTYIRNKIIYFSIFLVLGVVFFVSKPSKAAHQNAFICCLIDDMSFQYKTVVFYTGEELEIQRLSRFYEHNYFLDDSSDHRLSVAGYDGYVDEDNSGSGNYPAFRATINSNNKGRIALSYCSTPDQEETIKKWIREMGPSFYSVDEGNKYALPMSFPADTSTDATAADINRAYQIADTLGTGFNDALLFINNGESYISTYQLIDAAYGLCTIKDGGILSGPNNSGGNGTQYQINFKTEEGVDESGYQFNCDISAIDRARDYSNYYKPSSFKDPSSEVIGSGSFPWKIKKGYKGCSDEEVMEDGSHNQIAANYDSSVDDTTYISWEHLFVEAGSLYSQGITYANQADIYSMDALEGSVVSFVRNLLSGLTGYIDVYTMEDLIFNNGVRGSSAFYFGTFNKNWSPFLLNMFLIFSAIAVSLVFFLVVKMILRKNLSTANIYERVSLMEDIKDLLLSLFFIAFAWGAIRVAMLLNYRFVAIWGALAEGRTLNTIHSSSVNFAGIVIQFTYFILEIYMNYVYILRGLVIAALMITSPLFILAYNFGRVGKGMTSAWLKELLGSVFLQSFHAFIYGMLLAAATGTRGIESIVIVASVIPLTSLFKNATGSGGDAILQTAQSLTQTTANAGSTAIGTAASIAGHGLSNIGSAISGGGSMGGSGGGSALGSIVGGATTMLGGAIEGAGGTMQVGIGAGLNVSQVGGGEGAMKSGFRKVESGAFKVEDGAMDVGKGIASAIATKGMGGASGGGKVPGGGSGGGPVSPSGASVTGLSSSASILGAVKEGVDFPNSDSLFGDVRGESINPILKPEATKSIISSTRAFKDFGGADFNNTTLKVGQGSTTGTPYVQQTYTIPKDLSRADMDDRQRNLSNAFIERAHAVADDKKNNNTRGLDAFNRKYGVDYSQVKENESGEKVLILGNNL